MTDTERLGGSQSRHQDRAHQLCKHSCNQSTALFAAGENKSRRPRRPQPSKIAHFVCAVFSGTFSHIAYKRVKEVVCLIGRGGEGSRARYLRSAAHHKRSRVGDLPGVPALSYGFPSRLCLGWCVINTGTQSSGTTASADRVSSPKQGTALLPWGFLVVYIDDT